MDNEPPSGPDSQQANAAALLLDSGCFDAVSYATQCGIGDLSGQQLAIHYLTIGEASGLRPSDAFDPKFYLATNPDVKATGISPLLHYLQHGMRENRYPTRARLRADAVYRRERIFRRAGLRPQPQPGQHAGPDPGRGPSADTRRRADRGCLRQ